MAEKIGAGNRPQTYDTGNGRYVNDSSSSSSSDKVKELERKYNDDIRIFLPSEEKYVDVTPRGKSKKRYSKHIDSLVMNKYSTVIDKVKRKGYATVVVNDYKKAYVVIIKKSENDFEYDIIREYDIDG